MEITVNVEVRTSRPINREGPAGSHGPQRRSRSEGPPVRRKKVPGPRSHECPVLLKGSDPGDINELDPSNQDSPVPVKDPSPRAPGSRAHNNDPSIRNSGSWAHSKDPSIRNVGSWTQKNEPSIRNSGSRAHNNDPSIRNSGSWTQKNEPGIRNSGSRAHSNDPSIRNSGSWAQNNDPSIGNSGSWAQNNEPSIRNSGSWAQNNEASIRNSGSWAQNNDSSIRNPGSRAHSNDPHTRNSRSPLHIQKQSLRNLGSSVHTTGANPGKSDSQVHIQKQSLRNLGSSVQTTDSPIKNSRSSVHGQKPSTRNSSYSVRITGPSPRNSSSSLHTTGPSTRTPGSSLHTTGPSNRTPGSSLHTTGPSTRTPGSSLHTTGPGTKTPGSSLHTTGPSTRTPGSSLHTTGPSTKTPGSSLHTTGPGTKTPGSSLHTTGPGTKTPGSSLHTTGPGTKTPGSSLHTTGPSTRTPGSSLHTTGPSTRTPGSPVHKAPLARWEPAHLKRPSDLGPKGPVHVNVLRPDLRSFCNELDLYRPESSTELHAPKNSEGSTSEYCDSLDRRLTRAEKELHDVKCTVLDLWGIETPFHSRDDLFNERRSQHTIDGRAGNSSYSSLRSQRSIGEISANGHPDKGNGSKLGSAGNGFSFFNQLPPANPGSGTVHDASEKSNKTETPSGSKSSVSFGGSSRGSQPNFSTGPGARPRDRGVIGGSVDNLILYRIGRNPNKKKKKGYRAKQELIGKSLDGGLTFYSVDSVNRSDPYLTGRPEAHQALSDLIHKDIKSVVRHLEERLSPASRRRRLAGGHHSHSNTDTPSSSQPSISSSTKEDDMKGLADQSWGKSEDNFADLLNRVYKNNDSVADSLVIETESVDNEPSPPMARRSPGQGSYTNLQQRRTQSAAHIGYDPSRIYTKRQKNGSAITLYPHYPPQHSKSVRSRSASGPKQDYARKLEEQLNQCAVLARSLDHVPTSSKDPKDQDGLPKTFLNGHFGNFTVVRCPPDGSCGCHGVKPDRQGKTSAERTGRPPPACQDQRESRRPVSTSPHPNNRKAPGQRTKRKEGVRVNLMYIYGRLLSEVLYQYQTKGRGTCKPNVHLWSPS